MFHESKGLFFERLEDGSVRIIKTSDGLEPRADNIVLDHTMPENCWGSVVCSVSKDGETAERWKRARLFHGTEFSELLPSGADETPRAATAEEEEWMNAPLGTPKSDLNSAKNLIAAIDDLLTALGFCIHDERRISLEMARDHLLWERASSNDRYQADQIYQNMLGELREKHALRVRAASAAHQKRLKAAGMGA